MQQYVLASGYHESGVIIDLTSESDDLLENQRELKREPGSPAPIRGQQRVIKGLYDVFITLFSNKHTIKRVFTK